MELSSKQLAALTAAAETFFPSLEADAGADGMQAEFWRRGASELQLAERAAGVLEILAEADRRELVRLLDLLASPLLGATWTGPPKPLAALAPEQRLALLNRWRESRFLTLRKGFQGLKKMLCFLAYADLVGAPNPNWSALGYPGPLDEEPAGRPRLDVLQPSADMRLACDVVVVGSGAGGGLAAGLLAEAGYDVLLVDKGPYLQGEELNQLEGWMLGCLYEQAGTLTSSDGGVHLFAGSCLGGGTTVNWTASLRTPDSILGEWAEELALPHLTGAAYREGLDEICASLGVSTEESLDNPQNTRLRRGAEALGHAVGTIPRNVSGCAQDGCRGCGYCGFGCRKGHKRGTLETWIRRTAAAGGRVVPGAWVERVRVSEGEVKGVEIRALSEDGEPVELFVAARCVVLAAGAIHSPALLARSGVEHPELGRNLYLHPTVAVTGAYEEPIEPWFGTMMSAVDESGARLDGNWGFRLETPPAHPGLMAMAMPWTSGRQHKEAMLGARHAATFIVLTRDRHGGRVRWDRDGRPRVDYHLSGYDREHVLAGVEAAARVHLAAGAKRIVLPHSSFPQFRARHGESGLADFLARYRGLRFEPHDLPLFSAHQMGSCRMSGRERDGALAPDGGVRGVRGLYVADASALPSASGVNPMISIMGIAWHTVHELLTTL
ncbi:MAG: GMC family oxidoreductase N-terminal domain-containing protein [Thermoanaerobaculia bacterium]